MNDEPVLMVPARLQESSYGVPAAPQESLEGLWVSPGRTLTIGGVSVSGGMMYVGTTLKTPYGSEDPCLIDPFKRVAPVGNFIERQTAYWPSYAEITPVARKAYLDWLANGRDHPEADIGFVFLYFYGLERRVILDGTRDKAAQGDWPIIAHELKRLIGIYGKRSAQFRDYANELLKLVELAGYPAALYKLPVPELVRSWELPMYLQLALGQSAKDRVPLPAHLALAWVQLDPATSLRTPAIRCAEQFEVLFNLKYEESYGAGFVLPLPNNKLKLSYRPASGAYRGHGEIQFTFDDTPNVSILVTPAGKLRKLAEAAADALDPYSRFVKRCPSAAATTEALLYLPVQAWPAKPQEILQALKSRIADAPIALPFHELLSMFEVTGEPNKDRVVALARALDTAGIALEPCVLDGAKAPKTTDIVALFTVPPCEPASGLALAYDNALLALQTAAAVAKVGGELSEQASSYLRAQVNTWTHLTPNHHRRLLANLLLLGSAPVTLNSLKKRLESLEPGTREPIAALTTAVALSEGSVSPAALQLLEKIYKALGLDPQRVFSDVHSLSAGASLSAQGTVPASNVRFKLDPARIAALQKDTAKVSALLAGIFTEDEAHELIAPAPTPELTVGAPQGVLPGLNEAHQAFAALLLSQPSWCRQELQAASAHLGLMFDGALEHLNDASFDAHNISFTEGDDPIEVSPEILEILKK